MDILSNLKAIIKETGVKQRTLADAMEVEESTLSKILQGAREIKASELSKMAKGLGVDVTYLLTYPEKYVPAETLSSTDRVLVTFEVSPDKKEYLLKLVTGSK